ncbi:RHS repeat-associated core domain-containing protein [Pseudomonas monteilii]|uniref:RHS repeat-associated core domain-containing protein n=1 Tax=Pseudomonas monteilii TaxID=76759 RepID=UPI0030CB9096
MLIRASTRKFLYQNGELSTIITNKESLTIFRHTTTLLSERSTTHGQALTAGDQSNSTLIRTSAEKKETHAYSPYGHESYFHTAFTTIGFNGKPFDNFLEGYILGNGHRLFKPATMRFCSPDEISPFGAGGLNAYAYCSGDPTNFHDPSGRSRAALLFKALKKIFPEPTKNTQVGQPGHYDHVTSPPSYAKVLSEHPSELSTAKAFLLEDLLAQEKILEFHKNEKSLYLQAAFKENKKAKKFFQKPSTKKAHIKTENEYKAQYHHHKKLEENAQGNIDQINTSLARIRVAES